MPKHRTHSIEFKRQVVQDYLGGETLYGLAKRHEISPEPLIACASRLADSASYVRMATALDFPQATHIARGQPDRRRGLFFGGAGLARKISRLNVKQFTENPGKLRLG